MDDNINEFFRDLNQEIIYAGTAGGKMKEDAFFELYTDELIDAGEITTADYCPYSGRSGRRAIGCRADMGRYLQAKEPRRNG